MLRAYFDESGTHGEAYATSIAGFVATQQVWESIEAAWNKELSYYRERRPVRAFHLTDCLAGTGEFANLDEFFRLAIAKQLSEILGRHDVYAVWAAVMLDDWQAVARADFRAKYPKPFHLCFEQIMVQLWQWAHLNAVGEKIMPMFAHQTEYKGGMDAVDRAFRMNRTYQCVLGPIEFGWPSEVIPLQAADILAHEVSEYWRHVDYDEPKLGTMGPRKTVDECRSDA
jgi:hypothetical protein